MNRQDGKSRFLGNYNHDFPRLAKQSGFFFQLNRGKVNWSEIECLNLTDITEKRNFELLEQNLLNVINCNVEKEFDLKILDQNFVKLFKLAQLGIDYLSYCELYLDKCVVLLQDQLMSIQEEVKSLKCENETKNSEVKTMKIKKKINNYQCEKCEKIFISDVYLKFHDKRRHSNLSTPKSDESIFKKLADASQQTENGEKLSVAIQTISDETITTNRKNQEIRKIRKSQRKKIKRMERNVNDLNARLQRAEKSLQESREANSESTPVGFPSSVHYHALLQFMPPCFYQSRNTDEVVAEHPRIFPSSESAGADADANAKPSGNEKSFTTSHALIKECNRDDGMKNSEAEKIDLINDKENVDPQVTKPLPPPRKSKKKVQNNSSNEENVTIETFIDPIDSVQPATERVPFGNRSTDSTAVKGKSEPNIHSETFEEIKESLLEDTNAKTTISDDGLNTNEEKPKEMKSFFKKAVGKTSPKSHVEKLRNSLKRPFANLYDSVSFAGKDLKRFQSPKTVLVEDLNDQLRELGIDPDWKGIPKKTMKQKLKDLTHRRKLLFKGNPLYSSVRQSAEEKILKRLKKNFFLRKTSSQKSITRDLVAEIHLKDENPKSQESENVENRNYAVLYDTDVDSCSRMSELEKTSRKQGRLLCIAAKPTVSDSESQEENAAKMGEKEFDINMFQIKGAEKRQDKCGKDTMLNEIDELLTNSDFEEDSIRFDDEVLNGFDKSNYAKRCVKITN